MIIQEVRLLKEDTYETSILYIWNVDVVEIQYLDLSFLKRYLMN